MFIKLSLAVVLGGLVAMLSFKVIKAQDTEWGDNELSLNKRFGQWEGQSLCKRK